MQQMKNSKVFLNGTEIGTPKEFELNVNWSINENCPSYDCGYCVTYPAPYSEKCENLDCKWKDFDFTNKEEVEKVFKSAAK